MSGQSKYERALWTEFVRQREELKRDKPVRKQRRKNPEFSPAEMEAALDELVAESLERKS
jgi:hypothetical protein